MLLFEYKQIISGNLNADTLSIFKPCDGISGVCFIKPFGVFFTTITGSNTAEFKKSDFSGFYQINSYLIHFVMIYPAQHITYLNKDAHFLKKIYNKCIPSIKFPLCFVIKSFSLCSLMTAFFQSISLTFHPHPYHLFNNTITTILFHIDLLFSTRSGYSQFS